MELTTRLEGRTLVVSLSGKLDAVTAPQFEQKVRDLIEAGNLQVVVDFEQVDYISSAGLRALLVMNKLLASRGGKACLAHVQGHVRSVFDMSGFATIFAMHDSLPAAVAALQ
jgi:stage II sporulation protein AA (anti-sigma F factor antagonist)